MVLLYIDIDGVLLGKNDPRESDIVLARHAEEFLEFAIKHFKCFWLSTHTSNGDPAGAGKVLRRYATGGAMDIVDKIPAAKWNTLKTEALDITADFYWIDDSPLEAEHDFLKRTGLLERWIHADTRNHPDDLERVTSLLSAITQTDGGR